MLEDLKLNVQLKITQSPCGKTLDEYKRGRLIGTGGFSKVYEAICCKTGFTVAIKAIDKSAINNGLRDRILQEINIQSQLSHPSILKFHTAFEDSSYVCLVLEFCSEGDLVKYIDRKGISEKYVKIIMKQVVAGLEYLHAEHILHRDIKLANILLTENKQIKIADFGLATRITYPGEPHMTMCGTPNYISPEIVTHKVHGLEADLWSLGCLLYTLLVGKPPFETDTPFNTMDRITSGSYYMPPCLPQSAQDLIGRLLQKNPNSRLTLIEVRNHPFLSEDSIPYQKWVSSDSGVDTYSGSSNFISSKYHSLDRKHVPSNYSNGYGSFETPKSSRRCRSQDRRSEEEPSRVPRYEINPLYADTVFFPDHIHEKIPSGHQSGSFKSKNLYIKEKEFSPVQRYASSEHSKQSCKMFCENEILNHKDCDCWKCKSKIDKRVDNLRSSPKPMQRHQKKPTYMRSQLQGNVSDTDSSDERVKVIPFDTERLKPKREELKNIILTILENGDVCVERLRNKSDSKSSSEEKKLVVEVVRISRNGLKMHIYYPNKGRGVPVDQHPPPLPLNGADAVFNCDTLSKENWKKYQKAAQFVEMVKAKTPKLTLYTKKAKCLLMENQPDPDFQLIYHEGKKKITKSRKGITLEDGGKEWTLDNVGQTGNLSDPHMTEYYNYFQECYDHCRFIAEQLTSISLSNSGKELKVFPAILGKKPTLREQSPGWDLCTDSPNMFHSTKYPT